MRKCVICEKGEFIVVSDITLEIEGYVFIVDGKRCTNCNEEFIPEDEMQKVVSIAKKLGVWPAPMKLYRHLSKSGGGLVLRVPSDLEKQLKLSEKTEIAISKLGNKIIIETES